MRLCGSVRAELYSSSVFGDDLLSGHVHHGDQDIAQAVRMRSPDARPEPKTLLVEIAPMTAADRMQFLTDPEYIWAVQANVYEKGQQRDPSRRRLAIRLYVPKGEKVRLRESWYRGAHIVLWTHNSPRSTFSLGRWFIKTAFRRRALLLRYSL